MFRGLLIVAPSKIDAQNIFKRMKLPYITKLKEAYPAMIHPISNSFDAVVICINKDMTNIEFVREME